MSARAPIFSAATLLKNDAFTYFPFTDGRRFISPAIVFGTADIKDSEIEQEVVDGLGATASS